MSPINGSILAAGKNDWFPVIAIRRLRALYTASRSPYISTWEAVAESLYTVGCSRQTLTKLHSSLVAKTNMTVM